MTRNFIRKLSRFSALALLAGVVCAAGADAQPAAIYIVSGSVASIAATGHAVCAKAGSAVSGEAVFPGFGAAARNIQEFTIVIAPTTGVPTIVYTLPVLTGKLTTSDSLKYVLPPDVSVLAGSFVLTLSKKTASSLSFTLTTKTGPQADPSPPGTCHTTYHMTLTKGLPANLKSLL